MYMYSNYMDISMPLLIGVIITYYNIIFYSDSVISVDLDETVATYQQ